MKNVFLTLTLIGAIFSLSAQARSPRMQGTYKANLTGLQASEDSVFHNSTLKFKGGVVTLNVDLRNMFNNMMEVKAFFGHDCPAGTACPAVMPMPTAVKVPYMYSKVDSCGSRVFYGETTELDTKQVAFEVTVIDNTKNKCPHLVALPATQVLVREFKKGEELSATADFTADQLKLN